jgi:hypothetical protein
VPPSAQEGSVSTAQLLTNFQTEVINLRNKFSPTKFFTNLSKNPFPPLSHLQTPTSLTNLAGPPHNPPKIHSQLPHPFFRTLTKDQHYFRTVSFNPLPRYIIHTLSDRVRSPGHIKLIKESYYQGLNPAKMPKTKTLVRAIHNKIPSFSVCCLTFLFA